MTTYTVFADDRATTPIARGLTAVQALEELVDCYELHQDEYKNWQLYVPLCGGVMGR